MRTVDFVEAGPLVDPPLSVDPRMGCRDAFDCYPYFVDDPVVSTHGVLARVIRNKRIITSPATVHPHSECPVDDKQLIFVKH